MPLVAIAALRPRAPARQLPGGPLAASVAAHAAVAALIAGGARYAALAPSPPPLPLATFEMVVAPHATGSGTSPAGVADAPPGNQRAAPRPATLPPAPPRPPPSPAPVVTALAIPAPTPPPTEINLGGLDTPGLGFVEGHGIVPPGPDATWHNLPPDYPREAQLRGEHGTVVVMIHVAPDGRASGVDMLESSGWPLLDRAVLDAVRFWRFRPGERDGIPVASELPFRVVFSAARR